MMTFQLKKKRLDAFQGAQVDTPPAQAEGSITNQVADDAADGDGAEGKVRLSCDIKQSNHKKLRVTAAERYTTLASVVDNLIEDNL
jgi:hypothetical protein